MAINNITDIYGAGRSTSSPSSMIDWSRFQGGQGQQYGGRSRERLFMDALAAGQNSNQITPATTAPQTEVTTQPAAPAPTADASTSTANPQLDQLSQQIAGLISQLQRPGQTQSAPDRSYSTMNGNNTTTAPTLGSINTSTTQQPHITTPTTTQPQVNSIQTLANMPNPTVAGSPFINPKDDRIGSNAFQPAQTQKSMTDYLGGLPLTAENVMKIAKQQTPMASPLTPDWKMRQRPSALENSDPNSTTGYVGSQPYAFLEAARNMSMGGPGTFGYNPEMAKIAMTPIAQAYYASLPISKPQSNAYVWGTKNGGTQGGGGGGSQYDVTSERLPDPRLTQQQNTAPKTAATSSAATLRQGWGQTQPNTPLPETSQVHAQLGNYILAGDGQGKEYIYNPQQGAYKELNWQQTQPNASPPAGYKVLGEEQGMQLVSGPNSELFMYEPAGGFWAQL